MAHLETAYRHVFNIHVLGKKNKKMGEEGDAPVLADRKREEVGDLTCTFYAERLSLLYTSSRQEYLIKQTKCGLLGIIVIIWAQTHLS